jgi:putative transposase
MARLARAVFPGVPHHVTQRGNGRARTFFGDGDYQLYRSLLTANCAAAGVAVWAWVLMPNHVHLILVPSDEDGLRRALAPAHRRYAGHVHLRETRSGHYWQGRFGCVAMDDGHLAAALVYVALNPVRARLVDHAQDWRWSSARVHLGLVRDDGLTQAGPVRERFPDLAERISAGEDLAASERLRRAETVGRPVGSADFVAELERQSGRPLRRQNRGPKPKTTLSGAGDLLATWPHQ